MKPTLKHPLSFLNDENLSKLHGKKKLQHIWAYYKLHLVILGIFLYVIAYSLYGHFTYKETVLSAAFVNVSVGEELQTKLDADFLGSLNLRASKNKLDMYTGLYLTDDEMNEYHEYTYASRMKILASIGGESLDVAFMNKEAFDAFSQNGYLCDLEELLPQENPALYERMKPYLTDNIVILEDNSIDMVLDSSIDYEAATEQHLFGVDLSQAPPIRQAGFAEPVYWGIIANSPHKDMALTYLQYLFSEDK